MTQSINDIIEHAEGTFTRIGDITIEQSRHWYDEKAILQFELETVKMKGLAVEREMSLYAAKVIGLFIRGVI